MVATPTDKYTLMQGPNGEALVYTPGVGTKPIPDPANPGAPLRYQQAQVQWYDLLPQLDSLLRQADATGMQPGVVPQGYNMPTASQGTAPPSGPPKTSGDGRYSEVDTADGRMIQDNQSGVRYSANMAPQDVLNSLYSTGAPASTRPVDAATPVGQQAPPIVGGVVKSNVYGNPTAGERALGTTTTSYPLPPVPGTGPGAPVPSASASASATPPVNMAQAPTDRANLPILKLPNSVDYGGSASSIFGTYMGNYAPAAPTPAPTQQGGTQFRPLSVAPAPLAMPTPVAPAPQVSMKPAPAQFQGPPGGTPAGFVPPTAASVRAQLGYGAAYSPAQTAAMQGSTSAGVVGTPAYNAERAQMQAQTDARNSAAQAQADARQWGYIGQNAGGDNGEVQPGGYGFYDQSQLSAPPSGYNNPRPDLAGMTAGQAISSGAAGGATLPGGSAGGGGTRFNVLSAPGFGGTETDNPWGNQGDEPPLPGTPGGRAPKQGDPGPPLKLPNGQQQPTLYVEDPITHVVTAAPYGNPVWPPPPPVGAATQVPGQTPVPVTDPNTGRQTGWTYETDRSYIPPTATGADTPLGAAQIAQIMTGLHLTQAQTEQIMQMLPINIQQGQANIAAVYAGIQNAASQLGLQIDAQRFNQAATEAGLTGQYTNQAGNTVPTLGREQLFGFDAQGNPTLQARGFQHQLEQDYHANELADIASQRSDAGLTGYYQGQQTTQYQQQNADTERANLLAQASIGNTAAQIKLAELQQREGARQFDANNALARQEADRQWRQNPSSFLDQAFANRGAVAPSSTGGGGGYATPQVQGQPQQGMMQSGAIVAQGGQGQSPPGYTPSTQQGPLTYNDIRASGVEPPGLAAATGGYQIPQYRTAGGMPRVSIQQQNLLTPTEQQAFGAELRATGNNPADYAFGQQQLTNLPVRSTGGYSQPRPAY